LSLSKEEIMSLVKELRIKTDAGVKDCKAVLLEANGDVDKAVKMLRKRGIAKAAKKSNRATKAGLIECYLHQGKIAGLVELACETDFVARTDDFKKLAKEISIQVATFPPRAINKEDLPQESINNEKEILRELEKKAGKPENIIDKIVEGKIEKYYKEVCLMSQFYYRDESKTIENLVKESIAKLGENIVIKKFYRMQLGE